MASETKFLEAATRGKFAVTNWEAITGIGRFDAVYNPTAGQLNVTFKVFVDYHDRCQKWSDDEKLKWEPEAFKVIEDFWSKRYLLQCTRPGWEKYRASVNVKCVPAGIGSCHVRAEVAKRTPAEGSIGGGVEWTTTPPRMDLDNLTIVPKATVRQRKAHFNLRLYQIQQGLVERGVGIIPFATNSAEVSGPTKAKLLDYAKYVHRIATKDVSGIEICVYGGKGGTDGFFQSGLALRRAKAVAEVLDCVMHDDTMLVVTDSASKRPGLKVGLLAALSAHAGNPVTSTSLQGVAIVPNVPPDVVRESEMNYLVICHEFGHMLGLLDEYVSPLHPLLTDRVSADNLISKVYQAAAKAGDPSTWTDTEKRQLGQQSGMAEMLRQNPGIKAPTYIADGSKIDNFAVGPNTIMHSGMEVMPAHYLTLWSCLCEMTWGYINPKQWRIVPSPDNRSGVRYFG